jgi:hypothetical protein
MLFSSDDLSTNWNFLTSIWNTNTIGMPVGSQAMNGYYGQQYLFVRPASPNTGPALLGFLGCVSYSNHPSDASPWFHPTIQYSLDGSMTNWSQPVLMKGDADFNAYAANDSWLCFLRDPATGNIVSNILFGSGNQNHLEEWASSDMSLTQGWHVVNAGFTNSALAYVTLNSTWATQLPNGNWMIRGQFSSSASCDRSYLVSTSGPDGPYTDPQPVSVANGYSPGSDGGYFSGAVKVRADVQQAQALHIGAQNSNDVHNGNSPTLNNITATGNVTAVGSVIVSGETTISGRTIFSGTNSFWPYQLTGSGFPTQAYVNNTNFNFAPLSLYPAFGTNGVAVIWKTVMGGGAAKPMVAAFNPNLICLYNNFSIITGANPPTTNNCAAYSLTGFSGPFYSNAVSLGTATFSTSGTATQSVPQPFNFAYGATSNGVNFATENEVPVLSNGGIAWSSGGTNFFINTSGSFSHSP